MTVSLDALTVSELLAPARKTASENGAAFDLHDYDGRFIVAFSTSAGGGTTPTLDVKIQDSTDGSTGWADVSGAAFTQVTDAADSTQSLTLDTDAVKVYIRVVTTITGTSPTFDMAVVGVGLKQNF